ncbi:MAG: hypothetical protein VYC34_03710, partial [Planctomycetota bacterium]|nr:hypothetical protein [Planctomycetota bacterium]
ASNAQDSASAGAFAPSESGQWAEGLRPRGIAGSVLSTTTFGCDLIVAGEFRFAGDEPARNIARWDGLTWRPLGDGVGGPSSPAIAVFQNTLYAAGVFDHNADEVSLARWNGADWIPIPGAPPARDGASSILTLHATPSLLYIGGNFEEVNSIATVGVAAWNGVVWTTFSTGVSGPVDDVPHPRVEAIVEFNTMPIIAGRFAAAGAVAANNIAAWDGVAWTPLAEGIRYTFEQGDTCRTPNFPSGVRALAVHDGELFAGGYFTDAGAVHASNIARWNGADWAPVGPGLCQGFRVVAALHSHPTGLIAGGDFRVTGPGATPTEVLRVARWDGAAWHPLGEGIGAGQVSESPQALAFTDFEGALVAAGKFGVAGAAPAQSVARWDGAAWS